MITLIKRERRGGAGGEALGAGSFKTHGRGQTGAFTSYITGMGKGLSESAFPYRVANVFGTDLNVPDASNWNSVPTIVSPTTSFDLSTITKNHEVVVALFAFYTVTSPYTIEWDWYRSRDGKLLYYSFFNVPDPALYGYTNWAWYYTYSYIGWVDQEIAENGNYYVSCSLNTVLYWNGYFTVSGIPLPAAQFQGFSLSDYSKV